MTSNIKLHNWYKHKLNKQSGTLKHAANAIYFKIPHIVRCNSTVWLSLPSALRCQPALASPPDCWGWQCPHCKHSIPPADHDGAARAPVHLAHPCHSLLMLPMPSFHSAMTLLHWHLYRTATKHIPWIRTLLPVLLELLQWPHSNSGLLECGIRLLVLYASVSKDHRASKTMVNSKQPKTQCHIPDDFNAPQHNYRTRKSWVCYNVSTLCVQCCTNNIRQCNTEQFTQSWWYILENF